MQPPVPFPLPDDLLHILCEEGTNYAFSHGVVMFPSASDVCSIVRHAPYTMLPSPFPRRSFDHAKVLGKYFNLLVHYISRDPKWIADALSKAGQADSFTQRLIQLNEQVTKEGTAQSIALGIHRSDYMLHSRKEGGFVLQQVELNTIACAFPSLATFTADLHSFIVKKAGLQKEYPASSLPKNTSTFEVPAAIAEAWRLYGNPNAVVMMVVQEGERNAIDQKWVEYRLDELHNIRLIRRTLSEIHQRGSLREPTRALHIDGVEVAVAYFRAGYTPKDYPSEREWDARLMLERSLAVKCPTVAYQLAGCKKIQQVIAEPGQLERFFPTDAQAVEKLRSCFAGLYTLDHGQADAIIAKALANPDDYVLKPQREGGGNNLYKADLHKALSTFSPSELSAWILMDRIRPPTFDTYIMREGKIHRVSAVSELGIYSVFISRGNEVVLNGTAGHLLRSKNAAQDDGGVAAGVAVLDSPFLADV